MENAYFFQFLSLPLHKVLVFIFFETNLQCDNYPEFLGYDRMKVAYFIFHLFFLWISGISDVVFLISLLFVCIAQKVSFKVFASMSEGRREREPRNDLISDFC